MRPRLEKHGQAALLGWRVLRVTPAMLRDGRALAMLKRAFADAAGCGQDGSLGP
jgi:hypothetical protein